MKIPKINRRNFLITLAIITTSTFFFREYKFFSNTLDFDDDLYFSSFCAIVDNKEEFISNYNIVKKNKEYHNQTLIGKYFVNTDELIKMKSDLGKIL